MDATKVTAASTAPSGPVSSNVKLPTDQGMRFTSPGNPFYALQAITTPEDGATDNSSSYNWGLALTPSRALTPTARRGSTGCSTWCGPTSASSTASRSRCGTHSAVGTPTTC